MLAGDPPRDRGGLRPAAVALRGRGAAPPAACRRRRRRRPPSPRAARALGSSASPRRASSDGLPSSTTTRRRRTPLLGRRPPRPRPPRSSSRCRRRHRPPSSSPPADASCLGLLRAAALRRRRGALADARDDLADRERRALVGDDLERAVRVGLVRHRRLVRLDLDELVALRDLVPLGLEPLEDRALLHGVGQPRHGHVGHARRIY